MWFTLLLDLRVWLGAALIAACIYGKVQNLEKQQAEATLAQFRADVESEAAKAKVAAAQESLRQAENATGVLSDLQTRYDALDARYRLRTSAGSSPVPSLSSAAASLGSCPGDTTKPNPGSGLLDQIEGRVTSVLEACDRELAKYRQLWELQVRNSGSAI